MKSTKFILLTMLFMFLFATILLVAEQDKIALGLITTMVFVAIFGLPGAILTDSAKKGAEKRAAREAMKADPEYQKRQENLRKMQEEYETIVEVKLIGGGAVKKHKYGMTGAAVGGLIGGFRGAVVGSLLPNGKETQKQRFLVKYQDGHVTTEEHKPGTKRYDRLMMYVNWEDV